MTRTEQPADRAPACWGGLLRRNAPALAGIVVATLAVDFLAYALSRPLSPSAHATVTLLTGLLWIILAVPVLAASGGSWLEGLFRGGIVADASLVVLLVLGLTGPAFTVPGAVAAYLLWAAVTLALCALVLLARRAPVRQVLAVVAAVLVLAIAAGPFWVNGLLLAAEGPARETAIRVTLELNPVLATLGTMPPEFAPVWNEQPILYEHTVLGRDVSMLTVPWYVTAILYAGLALVFGSAALLRRREQ